MQAAMTYLKTTLEGFKEGGGSSSLILVRINFSMQGLADVRRDGNAPVVRGIQEVFVEALQDGDD